jgi:hypothetical protein
LAAVLSSGGGDNGGNAISVPDFLCVEMAVIRRFSPS